MTTLARLQQLARPPAFKAHSALTRALARWHHGSPFVYIMACRNGRPRFPLIVGGQGRG